VPPFIQPMLIPAVSRRWRAPAAQWRLEPKLDGWRAVAAVADGRAAVHTRHGRPVTHTLPELEPLPAALADRDAVLDGELVVGTGSAHDFYRLGPRLARGARTASRGAPVTFMAFDVLWLDGRSTCDLTYALRRELLEGLQLQGGGWGTVGSFDCDLVTLLAVCEANDLEGVVVKRLDSVYRPGRRTTDWVKVKTETWKQAHAPRRRAA
jgi:bifunctional non-homologous end joining protein LigD